MTTALYDQKQLGDLDTPVLNEMLLEHESMLDYITSGDWEVPEYQDPAILALAFQVDATHFQLAPSQIPTVTQIEADIDAGTVPLVEPESKHRNTTEEEDEPGEEVDEAARLDEGNRDS